MKKALMVWGGWDGHEPKQCVDVFAPWLASQGFDVKVSDTLDAYLDKDAMMALSLVVPCWTMGKMTGEQTQGLCAAVKSGVGIAGWHGGMCDSFRDNTEYQFMTGGQFVGHPGNIIEHTVTIARKDDPIVKGIADFKLTSERYYMMTNPGNEVLATLTFPGTEDGIDWIKGTVMPVVWKKRYGAGRVFYCAAGHCAKDFEVPELKTIIQRGLLWAAK